MTNTEMMHLPINYEKASFTYRRMAREEYARVQNGLCWYCKAPLTDLPAPGIRDMKIAKRLFPEQFFKNPVHLHHNHDTEMTIGAVHSHCNAVLWQYHGE